MEPFVEGLLRLQGEMGRAGVQAWGKGGKRLHSNGGKDLSTPGGKPGHVGGRGGAHKETSEAEASHSPPPPPPPPPPPLQSPPPQLPLPPPPLFFGCWRRRRRHSPQLGRPPSSARRARGAVAVASHVTRTRPDNLPLLSTVPLGYGGGAGGRRLRRLRNAPPPPGSRPRSLCAAPPPPVSPRFAARERSSPSSFDLNVGEIECTQLENNVTQEPELVPNKGRSFGKT